MTHDLDSLIGKGLLLTLAGIDVVLGFSVIHVDNGVPGFNPVLTDVIAVCQDLDKFAIIIHTDFNEDQHNLHLHYQPYGAAEYHASIEVALELAHESLLLNFSNNDVVDEANSCLHIDKYDEQEQFLSDDMYLKGRSVLINLIKEGEYLYDEPVRCVLGFKNPDMELSGEEFCEKVGPDDSSIFQSSEEEVVGPINIAEHGSSGPGTDNHGSEDTTQGPDTSSTEPTDSTNSID